MMTRAIDWLRRLIDEPHDFSLDTLLEEREIRANAHTQPASRPEPVFSADTGPVFSGEVAHS